MPTLRRCLAIAATLGLWACPALPTGDAGAGGGTATGGGSATGGGATGGGSATGGGGGGAQSSAPSGSLLFSSLRSNGAGMTVRHLWTSTITAGVASTPTQVTTGDIVDQGPSFSLDGTAAIFVRNAAGAATSAPQSLRVIGLSGSGERELATCTGTSAQDLVTCITPVMGTDGYVYYGDQVRGGPAPALSVKRVPFTGGTPSIVMSPDPACYLRLTRSRDRSRILVTVWGPSCPTKGDSIITLPGMGTVTAEALAVSGVNFTSYPQLNLAGDAMLAMGSSLGASGITTRLFTYSQAAPNPMPVADLGTFVPSGSGGFLLHDATTMVIASGWLSTATSPATKTNFQNPPNVADFDWLP